MSSDDENPLPRPKRIRSDTVHRNSSGPLVQHPRLWFRDGNVVIAAPDLAFKLHRGVLSLHSEVFRDMFDAPHIGHGDEIRDGCPVVRVTDCGEHLAELFTLLYDGARDTFFQSVFTIPFARVRAMTILAYKYEVDHVRAEALARLDRTWAIIRDSLVTRINEPLPISFRCEDWIGLANLARMFNLTHLLPLALYMCCTRPLQFLASEVVYAHGQSEQLSPLDLCLCLRALDTLSLTNIARLNIFLRHSPGSHYLHPVRCVGSMRELTRAANLTAYLTVSFILHSPEDVVPGLNAICIECRRILIHELRSFRVTTWNSLGPMFGVENWPIMQI